MVPFGDPFLCVAHLGSFLGTYFLFESHLVPFGLILAYLCLYCQISANKKRQCQFACLHAVFPLIRFSFGLLTRIYKTQLYNIFSVRLSLLVVTLLLQH